MKNLFLIILINTIWVITYSHNTIADTNNKIQQKKINKNQLSQMTRQRYNNSINIQSKKVKIIDNKQIKFIEDVNIKKNNITLNANEIILYTENNQNNQKNLIIAKNNVSYIDNYIQLQGKQAISNINNKNIDIYQGTYKLPIHQANGTAKIIMQRDNNRYTILNKGYFSLCTPNNNHWSIKGSKIIYDNKYETIDIWHAFFNIKNIPIIYIPYLNFTIGTKTKSKFLTPNFQYSKQEGFNINLPYHFNINNYLNLTISPNYLSNQNMQIQNTLNYNNYKINNTIKFNILHNNANNPYYNINKNNNYYWYCYWTSNYIINKQIHFNSEYTKNSNIYYRTKHAQNTQNTKQMNNNYYYIPQKLWFNYNYQNIYANLSLKKFENNKNINNDIYQASPNFEIDIYKNKKLINFQLKNQITNFINTNRTIFPKTIRIHLEPIINIPINNNYASINTELKIPITFYQQKNIKIYNNQQNKEKQLKSHITRVIPKIKIIGQTKLKKYTTNKHHYTQILKPCLQYLYIPYIDQKNIGIYDSSINIPMNHIELLRDSIYSGIDRIASANQLTNLITMKIYKKNNEILNISGGQLYFFSPPCVEKSNYVLQKYYGKTGSMIWISNNSWNLNKKYSIINLTQYNTLLNIITSQETILRYKTNKHNLLQLNWEYINTSYMNKILLTSNNINNNLSHYSIIKIINILPIKKTILFKNMLKYNIKNNCIINYSTNIKYTAQCWELFINYEHKKNNYKNIKNSKKNIQNKISFNIKLNNFKIT